MLSRENLCDLLTDLEKKAAALKKTLANDQQQVPPVVAADAACQVSKMAAKLGRLAEDVRRSAKPSV